MLLSCGQCGSTDDIVIRGNDLEGVQGIKQLLFQHFETKDLG